MKTGIIGDLHLRENLAFADYIPDRRIPERQEVLSFIVKKLADCDRIVMLGDQFHGKNNTSAVVRELTEFVRNLSMYGAKPIYILAGNHEKFGDGRSAIDYLNEAGQENWHIITNTIEVIDDMVFCPYFFRSELKTTKNNDATTILLKKLLKVAGKDKTLFIHHAIHDFTTASGASTSFFDEIVLPFQELSKNFDLVVGGHIHQPGRKNNVMVAGSIFCNEVGDDDKFVYILDKETEETIPLPGRSIYKLTNPTVADLEALSVSIAGKIVKIVLDDPKLKGTVKELKQSARTLFDAYVLVEQYPHERKSVNLDSMVDFNVESLLAMYAKERGVDNTKLQRAYKLLNI